MSFMKNQSIHFSVSEVKVAEKSLFEHSFEEIALIFSKGKPLQKGFNEKAESNHAFEVIAQSNIASPLVHLSHPFLLGMKKAYAEHRPFVLSPDMIWLLINQGFAHHINLHAEKLREMFVGFDAKKTLSIRYDELLENLDLWVNVPQKLVAEMEAHLPKGLTDNLLADFSTTDDNARIASQITILHSFKPYFEYQVFSAICGIPSITLEGSPEDWQKLITKTEALRIFDLYNWVDTLLPHLREILNTAKGNINTAFWKNMFAIPVEGNCLDLGKINGWIISFFPYNKDGIPLNLAYISEFDIENMPSEILSVPFNWLIEDNKGMITRKSMVFHAGFVGLSQDHETMALRPEIGWIVGEAAQNPLINPEKITENDYLIFKYLDTVPEELLEIPKLYGLSLSFSEKISIPEKLSQVAMRCLNIKGNISEDEKQKVLLLFPNLDISINDEYYERNIEEVLEEPKATFMERFFSTLEKLWH